METVDGQPSGTTGLTPFQSPRLHDNWASDILRVRFSNCKDKLGLAQALRLATFLGAVQRAGAYASSLSTGRGGTIRLTGIAAPI
jgi:hypothetical protein